VTDGAKPAQRSVAVIDRNTLADCRGKNIGGPLERLAAAGNAIPGLYRDEGDGGEAEERVTATATSVVIRRPMLPRGCASSGS